MEDVAFDEEAVTCEGDDGLIAEVVGGAPHALMVRAAGREWLAAFEVLLSYPPAAMRPEG